jgi:hypothetical protein
MMLLTYEYLQFFCLFIVFSRDLYIVSNNGGFRTSPGCSVPHSDLRASIYKAEIVNLLPGQISNQVLSNVKRTNTAYRLGKNRNFNMRI